MTNEKLFKRNLLRNILIQRKHDYTEDKCCNFVAEVNRTILRFDALMGSDKIS